jgi:uncharacterized membrane protein YgdD (TMEM256/DUF423 family)
MTGMLATLLAGLAGAAGVSVFAAAAHVAEAGSREQQGLTNAAVMLMVHAAAVLALVALSQSAGSVAWRWQLIGLVMITGSLLFGGAVALPVFAGFGLFPLAAPIGGSLTILAWAAVAVHALLAWSR